MKLIFTLFFLLLVKTSKYSWGFALGHIQISMILWRIVALGPSYISITLYEKRWQSAEWINWLPRQLITKPNKLRKWKKYLSLTHQHENQILKLNAVSQNYNQQYWTSKNNLKSKYNQIQQSISRTRHSDSKDNSQMFSIMLWKGVPMLVKVSIYLS